MKKALYYLALFVSLIVILFSGCKQTSTDVDLSKLVPADAQVIGTIDIGGLIEKSGVNNENLPEIINIVQTENSNVEEIVSTCFTNPESLGIRVDKRSFFFAEKMESKNDYTVGLLLPLSDGEKFKKTLADLSEGELPEIKSADAFQFIEIKDSDNVLLAWDNSKALLLISEEETEKSVDLLNSYFLRDPATSIATNSDFKKFYAEAGDFDFWLSISELIEDSDTFNNESAEQKKLMEDMKGLIITFHLDFKADQISLKTGVTGNLTLVDRYKNAMNPKIAKNLLHLIPAKSLLSFGASFNMKQYVEILSTQLNAMPNDSKEEIAEAEKKIGVTFSEGLNAFGGNMLFNLSNINGFVPDVSFVCDIKDKTTIEKLLSNLPENFLTEKDGYYEVVENDIAVYFCLQEKKAIVTTQKNVLDNFIAGKKLENNFSENKKLSDVPSFFYLNLDLETYPVQLKSQIQLYLSMMQMNSVNQLLEHTSSLTMMQSKDLHSSTIALNIKPVEGKNSLAIILEALDETN